MAGKSYKTTQKARLPVLLDNLIATAKMKLNAPCLLALSAVAQADYALNTIYQFPNTQYTDIENIAVRSNGQLLLTIATGARLVQLNPANPVPEQIVDISGAGSLVGIAETSPDVYTVVAGNYSFGPQVPGGVAGVPGSFSIWSIDLNGPQAAATLVTAIPEANTLNGLSAVPGCDDIVLVADSGLGAVWSVNLETGEYKIAIQAPEFQPTAALALGINGIKVPQAGQLLFTNSALDTYGVVHINSDGSAANASQNIATINTSTGLDDFSVGKGTAWIAAHPSTVYEVAYDGAVNLAVNSTALVSPTATSFSQDGCTLYITTGGAGGPTPVSGGVFSINVCAKTMARKWVA